MICRVLVLFLVTGWLTGCRTSPSGSARPGPVAPSVVARYADAGTNQTELAKAFSLTPELERDAMVFLIENMPAEDARTLGADFLVSNVRQATDAMNAAPWKDSVPRKIFLNDVLPYASVNEERDDWRARLRAISLPLIADCKTPGEAAHRLNQKLFPLLKVKYSTGRRRPDQNPTETMSSGVATCTGLSILLVDACRSVGIPARVVGTPMWSNMRGNHTWVEVWDEGWHFAGAAEPDEKGLDHGWFVHDASEARADVAQHSIYASSFKRTGVSFPLIWAPGNQSVPAVNVTERYAARPQFSAAAGPRLLVKVLDGPGGKRVAADLSVADLGDPSSMQVDRSRGETADQNDFAAFKAVPSHRYRITADAGAKIVMDDVAFGTNASQVVTLLLDPTPVVRAPSMACYVPQKIEKVLSTTAGSELTAAVTGYFTADAAGRADWKFDGKLDALLGENEPAVRHAVWAAFRGANIHAAEKADFDANQVRFGEYLSHYTVKTVGERPANGWSLFIAMHGGGGAPKAVNDSQWEIMQRYYKDHPEAGGYLYLALRAPNDTWNGFYDDYVYPLIGQLIRSEVLFADVDPNKVFIMGYSHGGYGAYAIGPKMPDHFAAIHASAAAATDGETAAINLRNTPFSVMVGEKDTMYGRRERNERFLAEIEKLRGTRKDIYPVTVDIKQGFGHGGLPDRDLIPEMAPAVRNPVPRELSWLMTDSVVRDFFWLHVDDPAKKKQVLASCRENRVVVTTSSDIASVDVLLDSRLVDLGQPVDVELNGATTTVKVAPSLRILCETMVRRGDPELAFAASISIRKDGDAGRLTVAKQTR
jgi:transglutaminase-like putative cysteine protease